MNKWIAAALGGIFVLSVACGKDNPYTPTPAIVSVEPSAVVGGNTYEVLINGVFAGWNDTTTVDFGAGVTVDAANITVVTEDKLRVPITVDTTAALGFRTLTVTTGGRSEELIDIFDVQAKLAVSGTLYNGQLGYVTATGNQTAWVAGLATTFVGTLDAGGVPTEIAALSLSDQVTSASNIDAYLVADLFATPGDYNFYVNNKEDQDEATAGFSLTAGPAVVALTDATPSAQQTLAGPNDAAVFSIGGITAGSFLMIEVQATNPWPVSILNDPFFGPTPVFGAVINQYHQATALGTPIDLLFLNGDGAGYVCDDFYSATDGGTYHFTVMDGGTVIVEINTQKGTPVNTTDYPINYTVTITENGLCP